MTGIKDIVNERKLGFEKWEKGVSQNVVGISETLSLRQIFREWALLMFLKVSGIVKVCLTGASLFKSKRFVPQNRKFLENGPFGFYE